MFWIVKSYGTLTEYSFSSPPVDNFSDIDNAMTLAVRGELAWFTEYTMNDVGFVNASYDPGFSVTAPQPSLNVKPGMSASLTVTLQGRSSRPLALSFADSEGTNSRPQNITIGSNISSFQRLGGTAEVSVTVKVPLGISGDYTILVTASDGLISRSAFVQLHVAG